MLDAFVKKGVRRVLTTAREHAVARNEDAVVSMVFTPVRFMAVGDALRCIDLVSDGLLSRSLRGRAILNLEIELWPNGYSAPSLDGGGITRCEPDLLITALLEGGSTMCVVGEAKWDWHPDAQALSSEVERQRRAVRGRHPDAEYACFSVVKNRKRQYDGLRVELCTWTEFYDRLDRKVRSVEDHGAVKRWALSVREFLRIAEQASFSGFSTYGISEVLRGNVFWGRPAPILGLDYANRCVPPAFPLLLRED